MSKLTDLIFQSYAAQAEARLVATERNFQLWLPDIAAAADTVEFEDNIVVLNAGEFFLEYRGGSEFVQVRRCQSCGNTITVPSWNAPVGSAADLSVGRNGYSQCDSCRGIDVDLTPDTLTEAALQLATALLRLFAEAEDRMDQP